MLGLDLPAIAVRRVGDAAAPPPTPTPPPPPPPAAITAVLIEGDSIAFATGSFARQYQAAPPAGRTVQLNAQNSRTVGGPAWAGPPAEAADTGTPAGNTLLDQRAADLASGAQAIVAMIGANDFTFASDASYRNRLVNWAGPVRAAGVKVGWSPPLPYNSNQGHASYAAFTARRASLLAQCRDPAVWGQWADAYLPLGEHPDFAAADNSALFGDGVHPNQLGQDRLAATFKAALDTLLDASRAASTQMYAAAWPASETNLAPATQLSRRFVVRGIAHAGLALTGGKALSATGGAQLRVNGGAWAASVAGWLYNGDVVDLRLTTSASSATAVTTDLTVGSETRTLSFATVAQVAAVDYLHGDVEASAPTAATHLYPGRAFAATGLAVIGVAAEGGAQAVKVGGVAATRRMAQAGWYGALAVELWTAPVTAGAKDVELTFAAMRKQSAVSWGVVTGADPVPVAAPSDNGADSANLSTGAFTVPAQGLALGVFGEYGNGASLPPPTIAGANGVLIDEGQTSYQSEVNGLSLAKRTTSGAIGWDAPSYGPHPRGAVVLKAAGT